MFFNSQHLSKISKETNFIQNNLEKVLRLSEILKFLNTSDAFKDKLVLKSGTAINLTISLSRLSVDIDLDLVSATTKEDMTAIREELHDKLLQYMWSEEYSLLEQPRMHHALTSYKFNYINQAGNRDNIMIEINYMNRVHILPLEYKDIQIPFLESNKILTLNAIELYASKINALISLATPRDLYDVYKMIENKLIANNNMLKKCTIFYNAIGGEQNLDNITFDNIKKINYNRIKRELKPVIAKTDKFDYIEATNKIIFYLENLLNLTKKEIAFLENFRNKKYMPELLFDDIDIVNRIKNHPMAIWRTQKDKK